MTSQKSLSFKRDQEEATGNEREAGQNTCMVAQSQTEQSKHPSANNHDVFKIQPNSHRAVVRAIKSGALMIDRKSVGNIMYLSQLEKKNDGHLTS